MNSRNADTFCSTLIAIMSLIFFFSTQRVHKFCHYPGDPHVT